MISIFFQPTGKAWSASNSLRAGKTETMVGIDWRPTIQHHQCQNICTICGQATSYSRDTACSFNVCSFRNCPIEKMCLMVEHVWRISINQSSLSCLWVFFLSLLHNPVLIIDYIRRYVPVSTVMVKADSHLFHVKKPRNGRISLLQYCNTTQPDGWSRMAQI